MTAVCRIASRISGCLTLGWLVLATGCGKLGTTPPPAPAAIPAETPLTAVQAQRRTLTRTIAQPAFIEAFEETALVPRIAGYVQKVQVDIGDRVRGPRFDPAGKQLEPGQVLAELAVPELEEEHRQKQALVVQAQAEVGQAKAAAEAAEAHIGTAKALIGEAEAARARAQANWERWDSEWRRMETLVLKKVIDEQTRDEARNQRQGATAAKQEVEAKVLSAVANTKESEAKRDKAQADVTAAQARVLVAEAEAGRLAALLQYRQIRSPYDGVVVRRGINTGTLVQPATGREAAPLFVVARIDAVRVFAEVPETEALYVADRLPARVRVQALKDQEFAGTVTRSSWSLDGRARTLRTEIDLVNSQGTLRPGMYAYVYLTAAFPDRLAIPLAALFQRGEQPHCYLLQDGKAVLTALKLGLRDGQHVEVLEKQLVGAPASAAWQAVVPADCFLQGNLALLTPGQAVQLAPAKE